MPRPLKPAERASFSVNAPSQPCESAITNLDNAQSNLLIARTRIMHRNKYETTYAPEVIQRATHQKYDTVNTILNTAAKNPLRAPTYFYNPRSSLRSRSAASRSALPSAPSFFCNSRSPLRSAPPDFLFATLRAPLGQ